MRAPSNPAVTAQDYRLRGVGANPRTSAPGRGSRGPPARATTPTNGWTPARSAGRCRQAICAACPVRAACLAHARAHDESWGIWGGRTTRERVAHRLGRSVRAARHEEQRPARPREPGAREVSHSLPGEIGADHATWSRSRLSGVLSPVSVSGPL